MNLKKTFITLGMNLKNILPVRISIVIWAGITVMNVNKSLLNSTQVIVNSSRLTKGYYYVRIQAASKIYTEKISIEK